VSKSSKSSFEQFAKLLSISARVSRIFSISSSAVERLWNSDLMKNERIFSNFWLIS